MYLVCNGHENSSTGSIHNYIRQEYASRDTFSFIPPIPRWLKKMVTDLLEDNDDTFFLEVCNGPHFALSCPFCKL